jgi:hypothetical protein
MTVTKVILQIILIVVVVIVNLHNREHNVKTKPQTITFTSIRRSEQ